MSHNSDDRVKISDATRARMRAKGLQFDTPEGRLPVIMLDDFAHTVDFPICGDPSCICHREEYNRYLAEAQQKRGRKSKTLLNKNYEQPRGDLGNNRGFNLYR